ncbi:hypothetical protein LTR10_018190 [Elasticomyces elasticus]|uniref:Uncharacterized protein n=1 Tax=Exophiala sideris TaxID=1016849 RepID=A0ABR0J2J9_9EURO|nr:hypothetical protein LTR10_018190 [Elasticomyces elasticus]KAK5024929.1 hypothetical protein LTS07_008307 [Exophiala sideris]KAK5031482.1 hypothetical protein LTR13_007810 [Exophiala sideris]KAK5054968.1 hypothetical protein LTR69_008536 [Exophiala sideris]KAK5179848.1 hypothetical protein LTR44_007664 [Eurotiomycetes sp. CCFEE 6388]
MTKPANFAVNITSVVSNKHVLEGGTRRNLNSNKRVLDSGTRQSLNSDKHVLEGGTRQNLNSDKHVLEGGTRQNLNSNKHVAFVFDDTLLDATSGMSSPAQHEGTSRNDDGGREDAHTHSGHIVGPVAAPDVQVLEQYMSPSAAMPISHARPNPYTVYSNDFRNPIVYLKVPRHRVPSSRGNGSAGFKQYESVEKMLEPHGADVVDL